MPPTRLEVPVSGGHLAALSFGDPDERAARILAIHGITSSSQTWVAVARALAGQPPAPGGIRPELLAVDLRGRGRSGELPAPFGIDAHVQDMLAVLDHCGIERGIVVGHSLGAYIAAALAAAHPERVGAVLLVDGGLPIPGTGGADPQAFLDAFLGPALTRLRMQFASHEAYRDWWRAHPALAGGDVEDSDLAAYADYDLVGREPELRSAVSEEAVRADAAALFELGEDALWLTVPATLLCAPRGLQDDPHPMQPIELVRQWAARAPELRRGIEVADVNHYTIVLGVTGARAVARELAAAVAVARG